MRQLVKEGARVDERRGDGATPLHVHAENGNCAVVAELLREKADIDSKDEVRHCYIFSSMKHMASYLQKHEECLANICVIIHTHPAFMH